MTVPYHDIIGNLGGSPFDLKLASPPSKDSKRQYSTIIELLMFAHRVHKKEQMARMFLLKLMYAYIQDLCDHGKEHAFVVRSPKFCEMMHQKCIEFTMEFIQSQWSEESREYFLYTLLPQMNHTVALLKEITVLTMT